MRNEPPSPEHRAAFRAAILSAMLTYGMDGASFGRQVIGLFETIVLCAFDRKYGRAPTQEEFDKVITAMLHGAFDAFERRTDSMPTSTEDTTP